ncbi:hypothetical protein [Pseudoalteromonas sp. ASV78]|uniref:hypothetical protein n=1 Tax=Pseudoalteromonas sp. ASV78 TaxID=3397851 RepID=UPI0039FCA0DE
MKHFSKLILSTSLVFGLNSANAAELPTANGYTKIQDGKGVDLYSTTSNDVFIQVVDLQNGGGVGLDAHSGIYNSSKKTYYRKTIDDLFNEFYSSKLFGLVNGQFFNHDKKFTTISFPIKGSWHELKTHNDEESKRSLYIYPSTNTALIKDNYDANYMIDTGVSDLIVGLNPDVKKSSGYAIGRSYIGGYSADCNSSDKECSYTHLLFMTAANKTQAQMESIAQNWGVTPEALIMMDGSGSAQAKTSQHHLYGSSVPIYNNEEQRKLPHVIALYEDL